MIPAGVVDGGDLKVLVVFDDGGEVAELRAEVCVGVGCGGFVVFDEGVEGVDALNVGGCGGIVRDGENGVLAAK